MKWIQVLKECIKLYQSPESIRKRDEAAKSRAKKQ